METKDIKTIKDAENYIEGCMNDFESGVSTKEETITYLGEYTTRIIELVTNKN